MPRPEKSRRIGCPPGMKGFKPFGIAEGRHENLQLLFEEYESIRLVNYDGLSQEEAAEKMNVSRPTLTRIHSKALKVIAQAFIEGRALEIEGGNYELDTEWYRCRKCYKLFEGLQSHKKCRQCENFGKDELILLNK